MNSKAQVKRIKLVTWYKFAVCRKYKLFQFRVQGLEIPWFSPQIFKKPSASNLVIISFLEAVGGLT